MFLINDYRVEIINSFNAWKQIASPWNELLKASRANTLFLTWEWLSSWAECFLKKDRALFIIAIYKNDKLTGIAPWYIHRSTYAGFPLRKICFLGTPEAGSDYLDVFAQKGREKEVADCLYNLLEIKTSSLWDCLLLQDMPADSLFYLHFHNNIQEAGKFCETSAASFCPIVLLPSSTKEYLMQISANRRQQLSRHERLFEKSGAVELRSGSIDPEMINEFFRIPGIKTEAANTELQTLLQKFMTKARDRQWIRIDLLTLNGMIGAGLFHFRYGSEQLMYQMRVDRAMNEKISIGNILVYRCITSAIVDGIRVYDFLKGDESYKFHWATGGRRSLNLFFPGKKISSTIMLVNKFVKQTAKVLVR